MRSQPILIAFTVALACTAALPSAYARAPITLRFGTVAPENSSWAREFVALARDVARATDGEVQVKWYFSGITGSELETEARMLRGQLDGIGSGGGLCEKLAPAERVFRIPGLFRSREEAAFVHTHLRSLLDAEFERAGFVNLGDPSLGAELFFTLQPVRTLEDLRHTSLWVWDIDDVGNAMLRQMGMRLVPSALELGAKIFDEGRADGFRSLPTGALQFQLSIRAHYFIDLQVGYLQSCFLLTERAFQRLSADDQLILRSAAAKTAARVALSASRMDALLIDGLFEKQGLKRIVPSPQFQAAFQASADRARQTIEDNLVPHAVMLEAERLIATYRRLHDPPSKPEERKRRPDSLRESRSP